MKELKDFIHLYVGCKVQWIRSDGNTAVQELTLSDAAWLRERKDAKLILRPIESLTDVEGEEMYSGMTGSYEIEIPVIGETATITISPYQVAFLLSKGFDLFGLHAAGLCVYENEVK
jgi:hypothetical protein